MFRVVKLGWGYKWNIQPDDTLVVSGLNYSKEVSPCQQKKENKSWLLTDGLCWLVSTVVQGMEKTWWGHSVHLCFPLPLQTVAQCSPAQQALSQLHGSRALATVFNSQCNAISPFLCDEFLKIRKCCSKNLSTASSWTFPRKIRDDHFRQTQGLFPDSLLPLSGRLMLGLLNHSNLTHQNWYSFSTFCQPSFGAGDSLLHLWVSRRHRQPTCMAWILTDHTTGFSLSLPRWGEVLKLL